MPGRSTTTSPATRAMTRSRARTASRPSGSSRRRHTQHGRRVVTARDIAALVFIAAVAGLIFMAGRRQGRWSCRLDYPRGFDCGEQAGIKAERDRWEAAGTTLGEITAWAGPRPPQPDAWPAADAT